MADFNAGAGYTGLNASQTNGINLKSSLEDFLKIEYTDGLRNEFAVMDALINSLAKDTITGKKKYKSFALGISDNIRAISSGSASDLYNIGIGDFIKAADTVDAEFDTTKLIGVFSITDETLMKSSTDGSLFDVLGDTLSRMQMGLKHTMNRYTYGSNTGKIGQVVAVTNDFADADNANPGVQAGNTKIANDIIEVKCTNSMSILPGMGIMFRTVKSTNANGKITFGFKYRQGKVWQKNDTTKFGEETLIVVLDPIADNPADTPTATKTEISEGVSIANPNNGDPYGTEVYARQLIKGNAAQEYTGLENIVVEQNNILFGVNRGVYRSLNCSKKDLDNQLLTESILRDMADHISLVTPEGASVNLVCAKHSIISTIEKQMYQFKEYSLDTTGNGFTLGRPNIKFDTYELKKDKYARDNNVYLLDTTKIGELLRKDFGWITSGRETILERRDGGEIYEAIMTKYADMYIDAWKAHACFVNVRDNVGTADLYSRRVEVTNPEKSPVYTKVAAVV